MPEQISVTRAAHVAAIGNGASRGCKSARRSCSRITLARRAQIAPVVERRPCMMMEIDELYQTIILDHSKRPRNFGELPPPAVKGDGYNLAEMRLPSS